MSQSLVDLETSVKNAPKVNETVILFILASVQFTHIMDFVIMMPMNPIFQSVFNIDNKKFGLLVSAYAASAGISGFVSFFFLDRFDRKSALLFFYSGFTIGTLGCAVANSYEFFLTARIIAGIFGGVLGALVLAIIGDVFHESKRGRATGFVMAAFSVASIIGIPTGLYFAEKVNWHFPFYLICGLCCIVIILTLMNMPNLKGHISSKRGNPFDMLKWVFSTPDPLWSLSFVFVLMLAGFCIIPYLSDYFISNVGLSQEDLKYIYFIGGCFTVISSPFSGYLADRFGKRKIFIIAAILSVVPILLITNLSFVPKIVTFSVGALFFICFGGRIVPAMSMITSSVERKRRGGFMSISSSFQQLASALAALIGGWIIGEKSEGLIVNFWAVGLFAVVLTFVSILISFRVRQND